MTSLPPVEFDQHLALDEKSKQKVLNSLKFRDWRENAEKIATSEVDVKRIRVVDVDFFGPNVGFLKINCDVFRKSDGSFVPGISFIRGGSVAILVLVKVPELKQNYFLMTEQIRFPVGRYCTEAPAGMLDEDGNFVGVAAKEIKEETGIVLERKSLHSLGSIFPSPGGCDEEIHLFWAEVQMSQAEFEEKEKRSYGAEDEGESIRLKFINTQDMQDELNKIGDVKAECAYRRWLNRPIEF